MVALVLRVWRMCCLRVSVLDLLLHQAGNGRQCGDLAVLWLHVLDGLCLLAAHRFVTALDYEVEVCRVGYKQRDRI